MTDLPATCMGCFEGDKDPRSHRAGCPFLDRGTGVRWPRGNDDALDAAALAMWSPQDVVRTDHGWGCVFTCLYDVDRGAVEPE